MEQNWSTERPVFQPSFLCLFLTPSAI
jgi:hypothetical protein